MVLFMMEVGEETQEKAMEYKFGPTELDMKEIGIIIKQMGKESLFMLMEMYMMVNG